MKKNITKINDYVYSNIKNLGVIFNYFGAFEIQQEELDSFLNHCRNNKLQFSLDILKFRDTKKYYIEMWNGNRGFSNNNMADNPNYAASKYYFTTKLHELTNLSLLNEKSQPEKDFILFNNNILKQKFESIYSDKKENVAEKMKLYKKIFQSQLAPFIKEMGMNKKEFDMVKLQSTIKKINGDKIGFTSDTNQTIDAIIGDEMFSFFVSSEFILPYFITFKDKVSPSVDTSSKLQDRSGEFDAVKFIKFLDETVKAEKYFVRFAFDYNTDDLIFEKGFKEVKVQGESGFYNNFATSPLWGFTTSLFIFQEQPDLGKFERDLTSNFSNAIIQNPEEGVDCSPFYIHDNAFEGKNFISQEDIKNIFSIFKKYEYNPNGVVFGREYYSNIILKYYPHIKAGMDERLMLEKGAHGGICGATGSGKSQLAINIWKQLGKGTGINATIGYYIDNIGGLKERVEFFNKNIKFDTYTWGMDRFGAKLDMLSKKVGLRKVINDYKAEQKDLESKLESVKKKDDTEPSVIENLQIKIESSIKKINVLIPLSERVDKYINSYVTENIDNLNVKGFLVKYRDFINEIESESVKTFILDNIQQTEKDTSFQDKLNTPYKEVNFIGKMGYLESKGVEEITTKTEVISSLLDIDNIENVSLKEALMAIIKEYLKGIKMGDFFVWDDFEKYFRDELGKMNISDLDRKTANGRLILGNNFKSLLNSKIDIIEYLSEMNLSILDISSLSSLTEKNKKMLKNFFLILTLFSQFPLSKGGVKYFFLEEFHNYLQEIDKASMYLKVAVGKLIKESRNWNCIFYLITQLYTDFKKSEVIDNLSQFIILDKGNIEQFGADNKFKNNKIYQKYMADYLELDEKLSMASSIDDGISEKKKNWRLGLSFNSLKGDGCFITKIDLEDFNFFN